ncbi:MAG: hypothetical protein WBX20_20550, partial [Terrimicrobiaceae bacterium]
VQALGAGPPPAAPHGIRRNRASGRCGASFRDLALLLLLSLHDRWQKLELFLKFFRFAQDLLALLLKLALFSG